MSCLIIHLNYFSHVLVLFYLNKNVIFKFNFNKFNIKNNLNCSQGK